MRFWLVNELVLLLIISNATPVILSLLAGRHWNWPLDGNCLFLDRQPLLGPSKTIRGIVGAVIATAAMAPLFDLTIPQGAAFAMLAMSGDLCSSFLKRRLHIASSRSIPLLDQLPEAILPLWGMQAALGAGINEIALAITLFIVLDLLLTRLHQPGSTH